MHNTLIKSKQQFDNALERLEEIFDSVSDSEEGQEINRYRPTLSLNSTRGGVCNSLRFKKFLTLFGISLKMYR